MIARIATVAACAALLVGCQDSGGGGGDAPYNAAMPQSELMGHVVDPAAQVFWRSSGEAVTEQGVESYLPTTDEGWNAAINAAATVAESGNLMMIPGRVRVVAENDNNDWINFSRQLTEIGLEAMEAAEARDEAAMFDTGARMYQVCRSCHDKYLVPFLDEETGELPEGPIPGLETR